MTCDAGSLLEEVAGASGRISALIGAAKQYSQMDRSPLRQVDVHDGLESTLTMLKHKLETGIEVVRDYDRSLPELSAYAGELNQVWTNLVDNAVDAMEGMDGRGRLTVRTDRDGDGPWSRSATTAPASPRPPPTSSSPSTPPSRSARAPASGSTSAGGSSSSATTATCGSPRSLATPASRCCCRSSRR